MYVNKNVSILKLFSEKCNENLLFFTSFCLPLAITFYVYRINNYLHLIREEYNRIILRKYLPRSRFVTPLFRIGDRALSDIRLIVIFRNSFECHVKNVKEIRK